ncbi:hypothetical protein FRX31_032664, partial [Thalictrum thalictroides]
ETFIIQCRDFQRDINKGENEELWKLLSGKKVLENENRNFNTKVSSLRNSMSAFVEEIVEELRTSNSALHVEIRRGNMENEKLMKDIRDLKISLIATSTFDNDLR